MTMKKLKKIFLAMPTVGDLNEQAWYKEKVPSLDIEQLIKEKHFPEPNERFMLKTIINREQGWTYNGQIHEHTSACGHVRIEREGFGRLST